jgi:N-hydroxyarylamine O-acetyltransferase
VTRLSPDRVEPVLAKLGVPRPAPDLAGLRSLYAAWCRSVPFDNARKLIHIREGRPGALPGDTPDDFFDAWLAHGTGGTCWAGNGALHALLEATGFRASRAIATMLVAPNLPPNHGSVAVEIEGASYLVDASILYAEPLRLARNAETRVDHPAHGVRCSPDGEGWRVHWRPLHLPDGMDCRIDRIGASYAEFHALHEATRSWSPFNFQLSARLLHDDGVVGVGLGRRCEILADGSVRAAPLEGEKRARYLVDALRMSAEIAAALPPDVPTPPPPGSRSAGAS